ncbi:hypothetical protein [Rubrivivax gelatinosus]|uniref:Uncharacterized protein n=1 Tax=Rubrivivax gelatinosus TaxID=28068 RepID=A0A4R2MGE4_RUBGE|nr:hypothetical protein [Rubrivivax gelatinosus]MBK1686437.1 hypothetical protein [Rubrivivax gelatinosus]TCP04335.1 hypothetical protein EV684_10288 [Rubrivivax gelatinosus]
MDDRPNTIRHHASAPPISLPVGHVGPVLLPGTNREVWWTGRVAIGLRYERPRHAESVGQSAAWVQALMLAWARRDERRRTERGSC